MSENNAPKVQLRGGFSDRNNIDKINVSMQTDSLDQRTRIAIINCLFDWIEELDTTDSYDSDSQEQSFYRNLLRDVFVLAVDVPLGCLSTDQLFERFIKAVILKSNYDEVLTLIEYIIQYFSHTYVIGQRRIYKDEINEVFVREFVGYRFIKNFIVPITDEVEIKSIEQCVEIPYQGCKIHIQNALTKLSDRNNPDYKNSIKESISAVESICCVIVGKEHATLGEALKILEKKHQLNGQLKSAFEKLYTYTNDEGGIRHANGLFEGNVTFEEAKFMLVSCSAFVNYLIAEYGKIGD